jgi:eukaryotic-like serine/threonine-protein kinase
MPGSAWPPDRAATAEHLARVEAIFHAALERPPGERAAFVRQACGADSALYADVEALLQEDDAPDRHSFERWVQHVAADRAGMRPVAPDAPADDLVGRTLSHYDITGFVGAGGMGRVYLARDRLLGRQVAVKLLPRAVADDPVRLERFRLEARAASTLVHPNVATVHELGEADGQPFIVMEYVDGRTLDDVLGDGPLPLERALDVALQTADVLGEAHDAGITHRDIKPGNVMITPRGQVKVLDFGLAKLLPGNAGDVLVDSATLQATTPGLVMGTIDYMSPEQALGAPTDHRADLFSLGVLLYQLVTGTLPFRERTVTATLDALLHAEPRPASDVDPGLPEALDRVLRRVLAKSPDERYQHASVLADDLEALRRRDEPPGAPSVPRARPARRPALVRLRTALVGAGAVAVVLLLVRLWMDAPVTGVPIVTPFTTYPGVETTPAFSPDGERIAYVWDGPGRDSRDIYVQAVGGDEPVRLTTHPAEDAVPAFSPDGTLIAFVRDQSRVMVVPSGGGEEREVGVAYYPRVTFSPDGQFVATSGPGAQLALGRGLVLLPLEGGEPRVLTTPPPGFSDITPAFSPDGRRLAFQRAASETVADVWVTSATGTNPVRLTFDNRTVTGPAWTQDSRALIIGSARMGTGRLWRVPVAGGVPEPLPDTGPGSTMPTIAWRGDRLAFVATVRDTNVWALPLRDDGAPDAPPQPHAAGSSWLDGSPDISSDGQWLAFASNRTGRDEVFVAPMDGASARQVTDALGLGATTLGSPRFSPDGSAIAFDANVDGNVDIYVVPTSGGAARRLTTDPSNDVIPVWAPDGHWIYFTSQRTGRPEVWRVAVADGREEAVTTDGGFAAQVSSDGRFLVYTKARVASSLWRRPIDGGPEEPVLIDHDGTARLVAQFACWRPTPGGFIYVEATDGGSPAQRTVFRLQAYDEATRRITTLHELSAPATMAAGGVAVSPDGRRVLFTQTDQDRSDIHLLQPYR